LGLKKGVEDVKGESGPPNRFALKIYRRSALMDVAKLHSQGQCIREIARQLETSKYWVEYSIS